MGSETSDTSESTQTESNNTSEPKSGSTNSSPTKQESVNKTTDKAEEKKRPCCVCKETRSARDLCYAEKGFEECYKEIQEHKDCMASEGFKI